MGEIDWKTEIWFIPKSWKKKTMPSIKQKCTIVRLVCVGCPSATGDKNYGRMETQFDEVPNKQKAEKESSNTWANCMASSTSTIEFTGI